ncbi:hypothetical protein [uncultured Methanolobus sp.]|uniref:rolling circle replication-associated protein n=1 Tax=uncultured Methanolobus sp. TaxID=218300 RepID=UPI0029C866B3|nr:hypothetical protein [uncultured Methanolobus sp.]
MAISEIDLTKMVRLCSEQPYTVGQLGDLLNIPYSTIYNFLGTKKGKFYFNLEKIDGLNFLRSDPNNHYLIKGQAKLKPHQKEQQEDYKKIDNNWRNHKIPDNITWDRKQAIRKIATINGFGQTVVKKDDKGKPILNDKGKPVRYFKYFSDYHEHVYDECLEIFQKYIQKIDQLELCFEPLEGLFGEAIVKPYATRFNSVSKQITLRENYEKAWQGGEQLYKKASFVTLTTDPKQFNNLWEANKHFQENWNKLITYLRKKTGRALPYVCVREFQKNGRVHFHIAIFGIHLTPTKKDSPYNNPISKIWKRYGQGEITDVKNLILKDGVFQWLHDKPGDCKKDESPMKYLKKYLIKAQYDEKAQFQYWIFNARFYTYSQCLFETPKKRKTKPIYRYAGTIDREAGKFYRKSGMRGLYKHIVDITNDVPPPPPPIKEHLPLEFLTASYLENRRKKI